MGPGREREEPRDINEVLIGYFGPVVDFGSRIADRGLDPASGVNPQSPDMWSAACLAVEQANETGGYEGLRFRLVPAWSDNPWTSGVKGLTRLVLADQVWAIIGGVDGPTTHLAEQVANRAGLALLNPVSTDKTVNLINIPWVFSCTPQDHIQARALARGLVSEPGRSSFLLASAVDHDSHLFCVEFQKFVPAESLTCAHHYHFKPDGELEELVERICRNRAGAVVLVAGASPGARLVRALRQSGYAGNIYGGPRMGRQAFIAEAGSFADGVIFPCSYVPSAESAAFEKRFEQRFSRRPDYLAAHTYDAVNLLVAAIRRAGLNRARIRDAMRELSPWNGVSGPIIWDPPGGNCRPVHLCTVKDGQVVPLVRAQEDGLLRQGRRAPDREYSIGTPE